MRPDRPGVRPDRPGDTTRPARRSAGSTWLRAGSAGCPTGSAECPTGSDPPPAVLKSGPLDRPTGQILDRSVRKLVADVNPEHQTVQPMSNARNVPAPRNSARDRSRAHDRSSRNARGPNKRRGRRSNAPGQAQNAQAAATMRTPAAGTSRVASSAEAAMVLKIVRSGAVPSGRPDRHLPLREYPRRYDQSCTGRTDSKMPASDVVKAGDQDVALASWRQRAEIFSEILGPVRLGPVESVADRKRQRNVRQRIESPRIQKPEGARPLDCCRPRSHARSHRHVRHRHW